MPEMKKEETSNEEEIPRNQKVFDNIFLWLALGILVPGILYTVWGLIEVLSVAPVP